MSEAISFEAVLWRLDEHSTKTFITLPFDVKADFGRSRCPVSVTICGYTWQTTTQPFSGGYHVLIPDRVQGICVLSVGDCVSVVIAAADEVAGEVPRELDARLRGDARARAAFEALGTSHQRAYARWVGEAKWPETRRRRADIAADLFKSDNRRR